MQLRCVPMVLLLLFAAVSSSVAQERTPAYRFGTLPREWNHDQPNAWSSSGQGAIQFNGSVLRGRAYLVTLHTTVTLSWRNPTSQPDPHLQGGIRIRDAASERVVAAAPVGISNASAGPLTGVTIPVVIEGCFVSRRNQDVSFVVDVYAREGTRITLWNVPQEGSAPAQGTSLFKAVEVESCS